MGLRPTEEPMLGEEGVRPAMVVHPPTATSARAPFPQNAPKAAAYPAVEVDKMPDPMVFEVLEPTAKRPVQRLNDLAH